MRSLRLRAFVSFLAVFAISPVAGPVIADGAGDLCGRVFAINFNNLTSQNALLLLDVDLDKVRRDRDEDSDGAPHSVRVRWRRPITGLMSGEVLVGIDFRPAGRVDGADLVNQLYGLATIGGGSGPARLYTIDTAPAVATQVGLGITPLVGTSFGFDFNPVTDRIRVVSDQGQNIRINPNTGVLMFPIDPLLVYPVGDPNMAVPTRIPRVTGVAYTNPDNEPVAPASTAGNLTNTVLYDLDTARQGDLGNPGGDVLAIQIQVPQPSSGQLNTVGRLGLDTGLIVGFDIGLRNESLAAVQFGGTSGTTSHLASIDLLSGQARDLGRVRSKWGDELVTGLAIELGPQCSIPPSDDDEDSDSN